MRADKASIEGTRLRRNPWVTALACAPFALVPVLLTLGTPAAVLTPHVAILGALALYFAWVKRPFAIHERARIHVDETELRAGSLETSRAAIKKAEMVPGMKPMVSVALRGRSDEAFVFDQEEGARALMRALGFDASQTTARYAIMSLAQTRYRWAPFLALPLVFSLVILSSALHAPALTGVMMPPAILGLVAFMLFPGRIVIGVDGVLVRWLWTRAFYSMKDIESVTRFERGWGRSRVRGVKITLKWGEIVELPVMSTKWGDEEIGVILKRIQDALALSRSSAHVEEEATLLARGELAHKDWLTKLRAIGAGSTATLRVAPVMPERLWRVVLDPEQDASARAAAAIALGPTLDATGRARLEDTARTTAAPKLRVALERAASDASDDEIEAALRELDAP